MQLARDRSDGTQVAVRGVVFSCLVQKCAHSNSSPSWLCKVQIKFLPRGEGINVYVEREILNHSVLLHPQCGALC